MKKYIILGLLSVAAFENAFGDDQTDDNQQIANAKNKTMLPIAPTKNISEENISEKTATIDKKPEISFFSKHKVKLIYTATACALIATICYSAYKNAKLLKKLPHANLAPPISKYIWDPTTFTYKLNPFYKDAADKVSKPFKYLWDPIKFIYGLNPLYPLKK